MKNRVFTRRRHALQSRRRWLKATAWLGAPLLAMLISYRAVSLGALDMLAIAALAGFVAVYFLSVLRLRDLSGEWTFF